MTLFASQGKGTLAEQGSVRDSSSEKNHYRYLGSTANYSIYFSSLPRTSHRGGSFGRARSACTAS
jgi:hypothetical protein